MRASEEPILQERRRLEIRIGGRSAAGRTDRGEREDSNYEFMAAEGARASLTTPSFGGARERRGREGRGKANIQKKGIENRNSSFQQSVPSLGLIKTSLSSEGVEEEGSCRIGVVYAHVCLTMENVTTRVKVSKST